jgi:glutamate transport system permease protein
MTARTSALGDALGPRGRRRSLIASVVVGVVLAALFALAVYRFYDNGQLDADKWDVFTDWAVVKFMLIGLRNTLYLFLVSAAITLVVGILAALGRLSRSRPIRWLAGGYVELFRATPLLLLILFSSLVLPEYGIDLPLFWYAVIGLAAYNGAVLAEIFRAGILSLEKGQAEAAYAVGLRYWQTMNLVVIPQAVRRMVPALISANVTLLKDTSLAYVVSYEELLRRGRIVGEFSNNPLQALMVVAFMFIVVNFTLGSIARRIERRQRRRYGTGPVTVAGGPEDLIVPDAGRGGGERL